MMANACHQRRAETTPSKHDAAIPRVRWMAKLDFILEYLYGWW